MSDVIHLLPDSVANQIAAGEVIQRPASVLKELVENAIDAGASYVQVIVKDAGRSLIQVTDNGDGMSDTDARMAFERHATSKITVAQDLFSLRTMGFRGEALASIAAVAQVELRSRREEDELGTLIEIAGSRVFKQESGQCAKGTTFLIKNLFFNVPARRRFLKSDNVEKSHLLNEFYRIVLVHPDVEFSFYEGEEEIYHLQVSNIKIRIEQVFGSAKKKLNQQLLSVESITDLVSIKGFIGRPEFAQKSAQQYFFVNGRYMRHPYFHKAVMLAYNQLIQTAENPTYFIYFEVDPQTIDINIHPTKTEIKFENEQVLWSILSATVKEALGKFNIVPSIDFDREGALDFPVQRDYKSINPPITIFNTSYNPFGTSSYKRPQMEWESLYRGFEDEKNSLVDADPSVLPEPSSTVIQSRLNIEEEVTNNVYFQLKNRYIITSVKSGMMMIDQRRAHIRILFDQFLREIQQKKGFSQQLIFPETIDLLPEDLPFFNQIINELQYLGFDFQQTSPSQFKVQGIPAQMKGSERIILLLNDMVDIVKTATGEAIADMQQQIALSLAETAAITYGQSLNNEEMSHLIQQLFSCPSHNYTPDGKSVMSVVTQEEIQKRF